MGPWVAEATSDEELYEQMKCSSGGVMLLVRLRADLSSCLRPQLMELRDMAHENPANVFEKGSRLAMTYDWLVKQFGPSNAVRAASEIAKEVIADFDAAGVR